MSEDEEEWTSISVTKPVLRWVSVIKSFMEYLRGEKMTNSLALAFICSIADYQLAKENGTAKGDDYNTFIERRIKQITKVDKDVELMALRDDAKSFRIFDE